VFEGSYDNEGVLVPKPFIERWIFPGLLFQIMVNPMLSQMLDFLKRLFRFLLFIGLARTARWVFAVKNCAVLPEKKIIDAR